MKQEDFSKLKLDYENTVKYIFHLSDIRFKLLGLLPFATAIAFSFTNPKSSPLNSLVLGILGLLVTIGILFYDQRNTEIYNGLMGRAKEMEKKMKLEKVKTHEDFGGVFRNRSGRGRKFLGIFSMWHDKGLAIIYSTVIWVWIFIIVASCINILKIENQSILYFSIFISIIFPIVIYFNLMNLDKGKKKK